MLYSIPGIWDITASGKAMTIEYDKGDNEASWRRILTPA